MRATTNSAASTPKDEGFASGLVTEDDLNSWVNSTSCTLEAVGWSETEIRTLHADPLEKIPLQERHTSCDHGNWRPPEVLQLETASASGDIASVKEILRQYDGRLKDENTSIDLFASSFKFAMRGNHLPVAAYLIEQGISFNESHFSQAMDNKAYSFLELFLEHGFDINESRSDLRPGPLADTFDDEELTRWFLDRGADPNAETRMGVTPLSAALLHAPFETIALLFNRGGPESIEYGQLLHHAIFREHTDHLQVLEYLFARGALININQLKYQDRPSAFDEENLIIGCGTPLHGAADKGLLNVVKLLLNKGADPLILDGKGRLAIDLAQISHHNNVVRYLTPLSGR